MQGLSYRTQIWPREREVHRLDGDGGGQMTLAESIFELILLSIAVASIAWTVTQEEIFREAREWCAKRSDTAASILERKIFYIFTCEYCFSHWVTLSIIVFTGFKLVMDDWRGYVLAFFIIPWLANQWMSIYRRLRVEIKKENTLAILAANSEKDNPEAEALS
ncbi:MAG: hypothetical protein ABJA02_07940 [Acidobacteriota bacterium]